MSIDPLTVQRWMSADVQTVAPDAYLVDAFELMRLNRIRHVPVVKEGKLVGIVSDRDVRHALPMRCKTGDHTIYGKALFDTHVERVMTRHPITTEPTASVREAAEIVCREKVGALPVVADGELVGIISAEDLLWAFVETSPATIS